MTPPNLEAEHPAIAVTLPLQSAPHICEQGLHPFFDNLVAATDSEGVTFWGQDGKARVRCRISRAALDDHFSEGDRLRPDAAFRKHRPAIEALARRKYLLDRREPDGSVLIHTLDVT